MTLMPGHVHIVLSSDSSLIVYDTSGNVVNEIAVSDCNDSPDPVSSERILLLGCDGNIRNQNIFDDNDFSIFSDGIPTFGGTHNGGYYLPINLDVNKIPDDSLVIEWTYSEIFLAYADFFEPFLNIYDVFIQSDGKVLYYYGYSDEYNFNRYIKSRRLPRLHLQYHNPLVFGSWV